MAFIEYRYVSTFSLTTCFKSTFYILFFKQSLLHRLLIIIVNTVSPAFGFNRLANYQRMTCPLNKFLM